MVGPYIESVLRKQNFRCIHTNSLNYCLNDYESMSKVVFCLRFNNLSVWQQWMSLADLRGRTSLTLPPPPKASKFFQFHAVLGKICRNRVFTPSPRGVAPPPRGNSGSATGCKTLQLLCLLATVMVVSIACVSRALFGECEQRHSHYK